MKFFNKKIKKLLYITFFLVVFDQITKNYIMNRMILGESIAVIPNFFNLVYLQNPGGAFSFFAQSSSIMRFIVFIIIPIFIMIFVLYLYFKIPIEYKTLSFVFAMIFGGACGNMIDRIRFRFVIDFLDFHIKDSHWPAFNIADSAISVSMFILFLHIMFKKLPKGF